MTARDLILGIETSCDDTSIALVDRQGDVVACETVSQFDIHSEYGGVYPELASRAHLQAILPTLGLVLNSIGSDINQIGAIGVTRGPGLIGSLLVGLNTAQAIGISWGKNVIGVNHLRGHLRSADLDGHRVEYPAIMLLVSGGHTILAYLRNSVDIEVLGTTRDDSAGEAYDKVARMLDFGMPGGPLVDRKAKLGEPIFQFPRPMIGDGYEFSFSGLKASVARLLNREPSVNKEDVAASFVSACLDIFEVKLRRALNEFRPRSAVVVGGVSASPQLRERIIMVCAEAQVKPCFPPLKWATDNAAMIALAAWDYIALSIQNNTQANPSLAISIW